MMMVTLSPLAPSRWLVHGLLTRFEKPAQLNGQEHRLDTLLTQALATAKLPEADARYAKQLAKATLRYWLPTTGWLNQHLGRQGSKALPPQARTAVRMALTELAELATPAHAVTSQLGALCKRLKLNPKQVGCLNALLQPLQALPAGELRQAALRQMCAWPTPLAEHSRLTFKTAGYPAWDESNEQLNLALTTPAVLGLRLCGENAEAKAAFLEQAVATHNWQVRTPDAAYPDVITVEGATGLPTAWLGYEKGRYDKGQWVIQDPSSAQVGYHLPIKQGDTVIDACAAPGTKTTLLAQQLAGTGQLFALDTKAHRLERLHNNFARLGLPTQNLFTIVADATQWRPPNGQQANAVLLDAPCSGLGTLAKHPEGVLRWSPQAQAETVALQTALLNQASTWVAPQGFLLYSVCSFLPDEGSLLVQAWLAHHTSWVCVKQTHTLPQAGHCDGFYWALLQLT